MKVEALTQINPEKARELWQKYQTYRHYQSPADAEIAAIYKRIAQGKTVIRALESIRAAGVDEKGLPRLAIARADVALCYYCAPHPRIPSAKARHGELSHPVGSRVDKALSGRPVLAAPIRWRRVARGSRLGLDRR